MPFIIGGEIAFIEWSPATMTCETPSSAAAVLGLYFDGFCCGNE